MDNDFIWEHIELEVLEELRHPSEYVSWTFELFTRTVGLRVIRSS